MSSPRKSKQEILNSEFADFFSYCKKQKLTEDELRRLRDPFIRRYRKRIFKRIFIFIFVSISLHWLYNNSDIFSWTISSIGRLLMIELLPVWDWTPLYNSKCLVDYKRDSSQTNNFGHKNYDLSSNSFETDSKNCLLCERIDHILIMENVTFSSIQKHHLERGQPILILDSNKTSPLIRSDKDENINCLMDFLKWIQTIDDFVESDPCDVETSFMLNRFVNIENILFRSIEELEKIQKEKLSSSSSSSSAAVTTEASSSWFFQLRNCQFKANKASRLFIKKPYYYPVHFEPFYSSWLLISNNYKRIEKGILLDGLVIVQQILGKILIVLKPKEPCFDDCAEHEIVLNPGEGFIFSTDLWTMSYSWFHLGESLTAITETNWI